jgi:glutathione peroxidase-family protein
MKIPELVFRLQQEIKKAGGSIISIELDRLAEIEIAHQCGINSGVFYCISNETDINGNRKSSLYGIELKRNDYTRRS